MGAFGVPAGIVTSMAQALGTIEGDQLDAFPQSVLVPPTHVNEQLEGTVIVLTPPKSADCAIQLASLRAVTSKLVVDKSVTGKPKVLVLNPVTLNVDPPTVYVKL